MKQSEREKVSKELAEFLDYLQTAKPESELTGRIENEIDHVSESPEWRKEYMTFEIKLRDVREEGREEGREEERIDLLGGLVEEGTISLEKGAEKAGMSVPEFTEAMERRRGKALD